MSDAEDLTLHDFVRTPDNIRPESIFLTASGAPKPFVRIHLSKTALEHHWINGEDDAVHDGIVVVPND